VDVVVHDLDAEELRALAPRIPFALIDDYYLLGNANEVISRLEAYVPAGMEHIVMSVGTGLTGGRLEGEKGLAELICLRKTLAGNS
jgi:phthiodiolone/phenolphthiodiolone dimycocerosates ketoreductase